MVIERSKEYLEFIRHRVCSFCGSHGVEPHHSVRSMRGISNGGLARKGSDLLTVPVCRPCHSSIHNGKLQVSREQWYELCLTNLICFLDENKRVVLGDRKSDGVCR